ncbi:helix-turn-helix domain-containing protein [Shewanella sp. Isolate13]|uniref:helix-turn-helix domain-containing protein n=1 Tax=Shewanella sp. Isolate13 TaxID=2908531 RepID=UPI001EFC324A|nr:helix-turn-helix transcriptional regulator [Shewanella sp. Isolate13]MCG9731124.1 helix-turn-helix domain-containing protein [Shewanella sp. Isolate13]
MEFGEILKNYRIKNGLTQQKMVERLNADIDFAAVTTIAYHRWESGKVTPNIKKQAKALLILDCRDALIELCQHCKRSLKFLDATIKRRWNVRRFGFDYCYDNTDGSALLYERVEKIPLAALTLQDAIYENRAQHIHVNAQQVLDHSTFNYTLLVRHDRHFYGQLGFHVMSVDRLRGYFDHMKYEKVNTLASLGLNDDDEVVFLSAFHSTRKDVFITFLKMWVEELFKLERIPQYTYFRLYGDILNSLIVSQLEPNLVTKGGTEQPRVKHVNSEYEWLGYLVPTHLILLSYGSVLECYEQLMEEN